MRRELQKDRQNITVSDAIKQERELAKGIFAAVFPDIDPADLELKMSAFDFNTSDNALAFAGLRQRILDYIAVVESTDD
ncbi:MAG: hypothetical protein OYH77_04765 [Pseudomonadota bacterium]|nr:hypothetical protein [Pseudomonadota bacterium]